MATSQFCQRPCLYPDGPFTEGRNRPFAGSVGATSHLCLLLRWYLLTQEDNNEMAALIIFKKGGELLD